MKPNVVVYGRVIGSYRTQNLIKALLETEQINTFLLNLEHLWRKSSPFFSAYWLMTEFLLILKSDIVIFPAMRHHNTFRFKLARFLKKKIITDFYVSFYDSSVVDAKTIAPDSKEGRKLYDQDRNAILMSDCTIFLNQAEARYYTSLVDIDLAKINHKVIPLCIDNRRLARNKYASGDDKKFTICWWGTYIQLHGLDKILEAAKILLNESIDFQLFLFGNNEVKSLPYRAKIEELGLSEVVFVDNTTSFHNGKLEPFLLETCDLALGIFGDSTKAKTVFTNKIADAFAMGLPVLSMPSSAMDDLLLEDKSEIFLCDNSPADIAEAVKGIKNQRGQLASTAQKGRHTYETVFSYDSFKLKIGSLIESLS